MEFIQLTWPFTDWDNNGWSLNKSGIKYFQLGIEYPNCFSYYETEDNLATVTINNVEYFLNSINILEFQYTPKETVTINLSSVDNPYAIINIAYDAD